MFMREKNDSSKNDYETQQKLQELSFKVQSLRECLYETAEKGQEYKKKLTNRGQLLGGSLKKGKEQYELAQTFQQILVARLTGNSLKERYPKAAATMWAKADFATIEKAVIRLDDFIHEFIDEVHFLTQDIKSLELDLPQALEKELSDDENSDATEKLD